MKADDIMHLLPDTTAISRSKWRRALEAILAMDWSRPRESGAFIPHLKQQHGGNAVYHVTRQLRRLGYLTRERMTGTGRRGSEYIYTFNDQPTPAPAPPARQAKPKPKADEGLKATPDCRLLPSVTGYLISATVTVEEYRERHQQVASPGWDWWR